MHKLVCIPCCKEKSKKPGLIPAIERYQSESIANVYNLSLENNLEFRILSGKFGLLSSSQLIPFYDQLLLHGQVENLAPLVTLQLRSINVEEIRYFTKDIFNYANWKPYYDLIALCSKNLNIQLTIHPLFNHPK